MPSMTDEPGRLHSTFDELESAERVSLAHLLDGPSPPTRGGRSVRSACAFGLVLATSVLLGRRRP
ncbi:MAG TPA: hypothetical protein VGO26_00875 [Amnibacterium sp.]|nr:hypothetical protein [Amnibacterium sp.]